MYKRKVNNWLKSWMEYNKEAECSPLYTKWAGLTAITAALERKAWIHRGGETIYPNMYVLLVGRPGRTRKGSAIGPVKKILKDIKITMTPNSLTRARFISIMQNAFNAYVSTGGPPYIHSSLTCVNAEIAVFFRKDRELAQTLCDIYDTDANEGGWVHETNMDADNGGVKSIEDPCFNLLGAITPSLLTEEFPRGTIGGGFPSRVMFVYSNTRSTIPNPNFVRTKKGRELYKCLKDDLSHINKEIFGGFKKTEGFQKAYNNWYENLGHVCPFDPSNFDAYWSRRATHLYKLCMALRVCYSDDLTLTIKEFEQACFLLEEAEKYMPECFLVTEEVELPILFEDIAQDLLLMDEDEPITFQYLLSKYYKKASRATLMSVIEALEEMKVIRTRVPKAGGLHIFYIKDNGLIDQGTS